MRLLAAGHGLLADGASTSEFTVRPVYWSLAIAGLFAWRGYRAAARAEHAHGRSPYGWEPTTWSIICFSTLLLGRLLLAVAISRGGQNVQLPRGVDPWRPEEPAGPPPVQHVELPWQFAPQHAAAPPAVAAPPVAVAAPEPEEVAAPEPEEVAALAPEVRAAEPPVMRARPVAVDVLPRW